MSTLPNSPVNSTERVQQFRIKIMKSVIYFFTGFTVLLIAYFCANALPVDKAISGEENSLLLYFAYLKNVK